jgi:hypothetical protein
MTPRKKPVPTRQVIVRPDSNIFDQLAEVDEGGVNFFYLCLLVGMFVLVVFFHPSSFSHPRWYSALDLNRNGVFTATDLLLWLIWIFSLPGDMFVQLFMLSKPLAYFFEISPRSFGQPISIGISLIYWWLTGGKRMMIIWIVIVLVAVFSTLPPLPLPR